MAHFIPEHFAPDFGDIVVSVDVDGACVTAHVTARALQDDYHADTHQPDRLYHFAQDHEAEICDTVARKFRAGAIESDGQIWVRTGDRVRG